MEGLGFPFPPLKERFEQLEETLQILKQVWAGDFAAFEGKHFKLTEPMNNPQPLTRPHPPILIGGAGEKKTLRLVAKYADACNLFAFLGNEELARKLTVLKQHCDDLGRDYDEIEKTALGYVALGDDGMSPADVIETCRGLAHAGIDTFIFSMGNVHEIAPIETIAREVVPAVAEF